MMSIFNRGIYRIKNNTGSVYQIEELAGQEIAAGGILDLMDDTLPLHYTKIETIDYLLANCTDSKLYQDVQSGGIEVVERKIPNEL